MRKLKKYVQTRFAAKDSYYDKDTADYAVSSLNVFVIPKEHGLENHSSLSIGRNRL